MPQFEHVSFADAGFFEIFLNQKPKLQQKLQPKKNKSSLLLKIAIFFGFPVLDESIWLWQDSASKPSKLSWLMMPFVILFYILRMILTTSINMLKLVTELGPYYLKESAKAYHMRVIERSKKYSMSNGLINDLFLSELLLRIFMGLFLLGRATTSPLNAMKDMSEIGARLGRKKGKYAETALWFLFGFLSLCVSVAIYTFVLPYAIQAVVIHFPVAAASAAAFFTSNFPNLVSMSMAASPIIMAGVEAFGAIVLGLIIFTDIATFLAQQRTLKEKKPREQKSSQSDLGPLEEDEYLLVEGGLTDELNSIDEFPLGAGAPLFRPAPDKSAPEEAQVPLKARSFCGLC